MATNITNLKTMVQGWIKEFTSKFYIHTHNGVDSLKLQPSAIQGTAVTGNVVTSIVAGTNVTISPSSGIGAVTVNSTSSGGTPGGNDTDVQYNSSGSFAANDNFAYEYAGNQGLSLFSLDNNMPAGNTSIIIGDTTGNGRGQQAIDIQTQHSTNAEVASGPFAIAIGLNNNANSQDAYLFGRANVGSGSGAVIGTSNTSYGGNQNHILGSSNTITSTSGGVGNQNIALGYMNMITDDGSGNKGQNTAVGYENNAEGNSCTAIGASNMASGQRTTAVGYGNGASHGYSAAFGYGCSANQLECYALGFEVDNSTASTFAFGFGGQALSLDANGNLFIPNTSGAPSTPTGGGILYVTGGALTYIGSSGTVTTLAPA